MRLNRWRLFVNAYFTFTSREKTAALILAAIICFFQSLLLALHFMPAPGGAVSDTALFRQMLNLQQLANEQQRMERAERWKQNTAYPSKDSAVAAPALQPFNPDTVSVDGWVRLGFSPKQAAILVKYAAQKHGFGSKEEFQSVFVVNEQKFRLLSPWLRIPKRAAENVSVPAKYGGAAKPAAKIIDINTATQEDLEALPMIGAGRAGMIIRYRDKLGGYVSEAQLHEVYHLPDSVIALIVPRLRFGTGIRKIDLNHCVADSLKHPYLPYRLATMIISYRKEHGSFRNVSDLKALPLVDEEILRKIAPYLTVTP